MARGRWPVKGEVKCGMVRKGGAELKEKAGGLVLPPLLGRNVVVFESAHTAIKTTSVVPCRYITVILLLRPFTM